MLWDAATKKLSVFSNTYDKYIEQRQTYEVAIFGSSLSRYGILADFLDKSCYKFSMSGMDLHGVELYISNLINNSKEFRETKTVILDLAYYTFNHDNCCTKKAINLMKRMAIYEKFDDWGSYCENSDAQTRIVQYNALKKIVGKKYESTATSISATATRTRWSCRTSSAP